MFQLFRQRKIWLPTWRVLLIGLAVASLVGWVVINNIHPFLAITERADGARVLVVEGWVSDKILEQQFEGFQAGHPYDYVCTTGAKLDHGHYLSEHETFAELAAKSIEALGVPAECIIPTPSDAEPRDRTFGAAVGFKEKRAASPIQILREASAIDVLSSGAHGRRTRAVYRKVLGDQVDIGIISIDSGNYDPDRWFTSSQGVKSVIIESISLAYEWLGIADR